MKYVASSTITWEFDTELSQEDTRKYLIKCLEEFRNQKGFSNSKHILRLEKPKEKRISLGEFKIDDVMPYITKENTKREYECSGRKFPVKMNSQRYFIFRECMGCVACGLPGTRIFLEWYSADEVPHFNLYGEEDGKLVLMTKDHIQAKSCGGEDRHSNYQTMCSVCNNLKGNSNLTLDSVRKLRSAYNLNKDKVTKRRLSLLLQEIRSKEQRPRPSVKSVNVQLKNKISKMTADALVTACDISLYCSGDETIGLCVYDIPQQQYNQIGCIRKGTYLEPLVATKEKVMCKLSDHDVVILHHDLLKPMGIK